ncbi:MAG: aldolase/citrate lyase family protein [Agriterribacter sp.]
MKPEALQSLRLKLRSGNPVYGMWVTLESASISEIAVASGLDWIVVDAEHGHLDWHDIMQHVRAAVRSETVVLVRLSHLEEGLIKRALDIGADGILIPHIETAAEMTKAVEYAKYPPQGTRGIGAERATAWGQCFADHVKEANDNVLVIPVIESVKAGENIQEITAVDGTEIFFFGPADYSASAGYAGQWEGPGVTEQIEKAKQTILQAGKFCGVLTRNMDDLKSRTDAGFRMLGLGSDAGFIIRGIKNITTMLGNDIPFKHNLAAPSLKNEREAAPAHFIKTDRLESMCTPGEGTITELKPGIMCEELTGNQNGAVNLFTAIVTFDKGYTVLPNHTHPHAESITLLKGMACVEVEERRYYLQPMDNITIPKGYAHCVKNMSMEEPAIFHIAMPVNTPQRDLAKMPDTLYKTIPDDFCGHAGPERITRHAYARRYASGPSTEFIDFFNEALIPGIGMSGGYALFHKNGRLPAHFHDFDESICIVQGEATCIVDGREYEMSNCQTALQPKGIVHYFKNKHEAPMAMIWVYAGPMPIRTEVPDELADKKP